MKSSSLIIALSLGIFVPMSGYAASEATTTEATPTASDLVNAEVRKVDASQGKITLKHGPIDSLGMPAMTMVFRVADHGMLARVKAGDQVKFQADRLDGSFRVVSLVGPESSGR